MRRRSFLTGAATSAPILAASTVTADTTLTEWQKRLLMLTEGLNQREARFVMTSAEIIADQRDERLSALRGSQVEAA